MKNTLRFFVDPEALRTDEVRIVDQALIHQIGRVLRLGPGDHILLLDGQGSSCEVKIATVGRSEIAATVVTRAPALGEPPLTLTVYLPLIRPERFEWALQKCVELGASSLVPVHFARSLLADRADARKLERWRRIVREAAEQACRGILPSLEAPITFAEACARAATTELPIILWERHAPSLRTLLLSRLASGMVPPATCAVLSGPEGGITDAELTAASAHGIMPASLGPRLVRAETAPVAAAAAIIYQLE